MTVTVKELRAFLDKQPDDAELWLAGVPRSPLIGYTPASPGPGGKQVITLAFDTRGLIPDSESP